MRTFRLNPKLFEQLHSGRRTLDVRVGDYRLGDLVRYEEHLFDEGRDTGRWAEFIVASVEEHPCGASLLTLVHHRVPGLASSCCSVAAA